jgi:hypothetical protein
MAAPLTLCVSVSQASVCACANALIMDESHTLAHKRLFASRTNVTFARCATRAAAVADPSAAHAGKAEHEAASPRARINHQSCLQIHLRSD